MNFRIGLPRATRAGVLAGLALLLALWSGLVAGQEPGRPANVAEIAARRLRVEKGLLHTGDRWISASEAKLRRLLRRLPAVVARIERTHPALAGRVAENRAAWSRRAKASGAARAAASARAARSTSAPSSAVEPSRLGDVETVRRQVIDLIGDRQEVAVSLAAVRDLLKELPADYRRLRADGAVKDLLAATGTGDRLGPPGDYREQLAAVEALAAKVRALPEPIYLIGTKVRFGAVVNERHPATFTLGDRHDPTLVTLSTAERLGLAPGAENKPSKLRIAGQNRAAPMVTIARIEVGPVVLRNVQAHILPADLENHGNLLGRDLRRAAKVAVDLANLTMKLTMKLRE